MPGRHASRPVPTRSRTTSSRPSACAATSASSQPSFDVEVSRASTAGHCRLERPLVLALGVRDHRLQGQVADPVLLVGVVGLPDVDGVVEAASLGDVTLDRGQEDRQGIGRPEPEPVLGDVLEGGARLVVAARARAT